MGQKNSKDNKEYNIPVNMKLSTDISRAINIKTSPDEISRFKHIMNKKLNREFNSSQFSYKFQQNRKGVKHITSLLSLIYIKSTNTHLKQKANKTLYESVFNYNIIENDCKGYGEFNKNIISQMGLFINGEQSSPKDNVFIPQLTTFKSIHQDDENENDNNKENSKDSSNQEDPFLDKNSSHIKKTNTANDTDNENIIKAIQEIKESKLGQNYYADNSTAKPQLKLHNQSSLKERNANIPLVQNDNDSIRLTEGGDKRRASPNMDNQSLNLNLDNNNNNRETNSMIVLKGKQSKASSPGQRISKGNRNRSNKKDSKKQPLVNIKINLKDLIKQDVYETSSLLPRDRFKATMERRSRSRSRTPSPNQGKEKAFNDSVNNMTSIKASDISQIVINDGSFLDLVDALSQPNIKEEKRVHSRTPKKRTTTYENDNPKSKTKNEKFTKMFNVTHKKTNMA